MNDPEKLVVEAETVTAARVRQQVYFPATEEKLPLLLGLLKQNPTNRGMVFVNTKYACERVALTLERAGYKVGVLSGDVPQKKRETLLGRFTRGELSLLVATDVAARGLHIPDVTHVFNFDLPYDAEDYVHRIGRTARLGAEGDAISFACDEYAMHLPDIETYIEQKIPVAKMDPSILLPVPRAPRRQEGEQREESVVENALSEAAAERQKRRDRDGGRSGGGRSGRSDGGGRGRTSSGGRSDNRNEGRSGGGRPRDEQPRRPVAEVPAPEAAVTALAGTGDDNAAGGEAKRRRRRSRTERRDNETQVVAAKPNATKHQPPKLLTRIKQKLKRFFGF
jgi:ATP-dependent RNA helicase RhlB